MESCCFSDAVFAVDNGLLLSADNDELLSFRLQPDGTWQPTNEAPAISLQDGDWINEISLKDDLAAIGYNTVLGEERVNRTAMFFRGSDGVWTHRGEIEGGVTAIGGQKVLVGVPNSYQSELATAFVYGFDQDFEFEQESQLDPSVRNFGDDYAKNLAISGDTAVVTAYDTLLNRVSKPWTGTAFVYQRQLDGNWLETQLLETGEPGNLGYSIDSDGDLFVIGDFADERGATPRAIIYEKQADGSLSLLHEIIAPNAVKHVGIEGERVVLQTISNGAFLYDRRSDGSWSRTAEFVVVESFGEIRMTSFADDVVVEDGYAFIAESGKAYVFELPAVPEPSTLIIALSVAMCSMVRRDALRSVRS